MRLALEMNSLVLKTNVLKMHFELHPNTHSLATSDFQAEIISTSDFQAEFISR